MGRFAAVLVLLAFCCPSYADSACAYVFTSGGSNPALQSCVSANGNLAHLTTPFNVENIAAGTGGEGYGICDLTGNGTGYWDYAVDYSSTPLNLPADSGNWNNPVLLDSSEDSVRIRRSTSDNLWTLTQTITQHHSSVKVVMSLKNNSSVDRLVNLFRFADVTIAGFPNNNFDATSMTAFAWDSSGSSTPPYGIMLQNVGAPMGFDQSKTIETVPALRDVNYPPHPCVPTTKFGPLSPVDGSMIMFYGGTVPAHRSAVATMTYSGM